MTSRMALLTTSPSRMRKPIIVSRSIAWMVNRFSTRNAATPPAIASGMDSMTRVASRSERNMAAIIRNSTAAAVARFTAMFENASSSLSAVPRYARVTSAGRISRICGPAISRRFCSASCTVMSSGGVTESVSVRWPLTRSSWVGPTVRWMSVSSPRVCSPASGVATGVDASCSGDVQVGPLRIMSMRSLPSKYSPTNVPLVSARTMVATVARSRPAAVMRRSFGASCSSGSAMARPGLGLTCAPGTASLTIGMACIATSDRTLISGPCRSTLIARPPSKPKFSSEERCTNDCVSGRSTSTSLRTMSIISSMRDGSCG